MKNVIKHLAIGLMTLGLASFAGQSTDQRQEEQTQQEQEQRQTQQQQDQDQRDQQQQDQRDCGMLASSYLEIFVTDPCSHVYLQGQLMKAVRSHNRSFIIPGLETCKKYKYNVIITHGDRAESFDLLIEANQVQRIGVR
jgi:type II secretory pathway pseudopilin PulG